MNEQDFIELLNSVARIAKPFDNGYKDVTALSDKLVDSGLDSLDLLLTSVYLCDIFNIDEEKGKQFQPITVQDVYDFLMANKTQTPSSVEEALKGIK
jgi:hypothetical protein